MLKMNTQDRMVIGILYLTLLGVGLVNEFKIEKGFQALGNGYYFSRTNADQIWRTNVVEKLVPVADSNYDIIRAMIRSNFTVTNLVENVPETVTSTNDLKSKWPTNGYVFEFSSNNYTNILRIDLSNRYAVNIPGSFPLIQFTDGEWKFITNHFRRFTNDTYMEFCY